MPVTGKTRHCAGYPVLLRETFRRREGNQLAGTSQIVIVCRDLVSGRVRAYHFRQRTNYRHARKTPGK